MEYTVTQENQNNFTALPKPKEIRKLAKANFKPRNHNPGQNIWKKIEKSSKIGQGKKSMVTTSAGFLTATAKGYFEKKLELSWKQTMTS